MKQVNINQLAIALLVGIGVYLGFNGSAWICIASGFCAGVLVQAIADIQQYRRRREKDLRLIEKKLSHIQASLKKKSQADTPSKPPCIVVQDIISQKTNDERTYFVLTDPVSDADWFKLINTMNQSQLKHATRVQALFPSQPSTLSNRTHTNFISDPNNTKSFHFPSQLISFN